MQSLYLFSSHINSTLLKLFFESFGSEFTLVNWSQKVEILRVNLQSILNQLSIPHRMIIQNSISRIENMTNNYSQRLLVELSDVGERNELQKLSSSRERACWVFLNNNDVFLKAEAICNTDYSRRSKFWSYYCTAAHKEKVCFSDSLIKQYNDHIKKILQLFNEYVSTTFVERVSVNDRGVEENEAHLCIYHSQLQEKYLVVDDHETMTSKSASWVLEYKVIYRKSSGVIEVFAPDKSRRLILAHIFSTVFLQSEHLVQKTYHLQPLLNPSHLSLDNEDGIESVNIVKLSLQNSELDSQLHIDFNGVSDIHQYLNNYLGHDNLLSMGTFVPIKATIVINFYGDNEGQHKPLSISLCLPNQCDLRCRTEDERLLGEKYLGRWGVVSE